MRRKNIAGQEASQLEDAPMVLYCSAVWEPFEFSVSYDDHGNKVLDKTGTMCKKHATCSLYVSSNTSNMSGHL